MYFVFMVFYSFLGSTRGLPGFSYAISPRSNDYRYMRWQVNLFCTVRQWRTVAAARFGNVVGRSALFIRFFASAWRSYP